MGIKIEIKGVIVSEDDALIYEWFGIEATSPKKVVSAINSAGGQDIEVSINSYGGDLYAGSEIYTALKDYSGNSVGKIVGMAASAASIIAMGVKKLMITPTGQLMIHNVMSGFDYGNHADFEKSAEILKIADKGVSNAYMLKTGKSQKEILALMEEETYMDAKTSLEHGFVDEIMFDNEFKLSASATSKMSLLPQEVINKMRNHLQEKQSKSTVNADELFLYEKMLQTKQKKFKEV